MNRTKFNHHLGVEDRKPFAQLRLRARAGSLIVLLLAMLIGLSACGGGNSSNSQIAGQLAGNWQFTMTPPTDNSFVGGIQGGFLLQNNNGTLTGEVTYAISLPPSSSTSPPTLCNSGAAAVTGTVNGQTVTLTVVTSPQTFTLSGTLSTSGTTIVGTYNSTDGKGCGTAQIALPWTAILVPPLTGTVQGFFHSVLNPALKNQVFPVTGTLTQGENIGASNATVTGTLNFQNYPCLSSALVNGQVSGSSVILQIIGSNGLNAGQIGAPASTTSNPLPVTVLSSAAGAVLQGTNGYGVSSSSCPAGTAPGDIGDVCLGVGNTTSCTQPILLSPSPLTFPAQQVGSLATTQTVALTNNNITTNPLTGLTLSLTSINPAPGITSPFSLPSDFDGLPDFTEQDDCASSPGKAFSLNPQQSCIITILFAPQQSCPWLPSIALSGEPPSACPFPLQATLTVKSPVSADNNTAFALPISGIGFSAVIPSTPELAFGAEAVGEASAPQSLSFFNQGANPVQILPALSTPCVNPPVGVLTLPRPLTPGGIAGLQVDTGVITAEPADNPPTITYNCDSDLTSKLPNFQISADDCSGTLLMPLQTCNLEITFAPQPSTPLSPALDYFLELNTLQCTSTVTSNCEIDSGRFPVELKANLPSPLRMTPAAGLNFGLVPVGETSSPLTVTLYNDPKDPNAGTINFTGNILQGSAFEETDNCAGNLASGASCTFTVTFLPAKSGVLATGTITVGYTAGQTQNIQTIYLLGTGQ
jgi:hypothetical protein